jgi:hypothetical protein
VLRQRNSRIVIAVSVLAVAAACSSHPPTYHSAAKLAKAIGCQSFVMGPSTDHGSNYTDMGSCTLGASRVGIYIFATNNARDRWQRVASTGNYIAGTCYAVGLNKDLVDTTGDKIGAPIRSKDPSTDAPGDAD